MDKEVAPQVLAAIDEMRLSGPRLTPVEIVAKMGVFDARDKPFEHAWLATGDNVIATVWGEHVNIGAGGRWFCIEPLDIRLRPGGGERTPNQIQRAKDRLALLKRTFDADQNFRAVLQTNRIAIAELESNKNAKVSTRVRDEAEWHVATWEPEKKRAVLVRGARGWVPDEAELQAAKVRGSAAVEANKPQSAAAPSSSTSAPEPVSAEELKVAAMDYVMRHFKGYGYKAEDLSSTGVGFDIEVSSSKGTLLRVAVRGVSSGVPGFQLTSEEQASSVREPLWRLLIVTDAGTSVAQHKIYKPSEISQVPGAAA